MSEKGFLGRWSRRKREARVGLGPSQPETSMQATPLTAAEAGFVEPEIDLSALPPIDSITGASDITAFLRKGIPQELTRAALRRAWSADPAVRDFVGLAENAWDFNDPNAMPGFGPLDCSEAELSALVDRIVGGVRETVQTLSDPQGMSETVDSTLCQASPPGSDRPQATRERGPGDIPATAALSSALFAAQPKGSDETESELNVVRRRTHGGALPRDDD